MTDTPDPAFNLWSEPWITLETNAGALEERSIEQALSQAHKYRAIYEQSPLVVVGIHRLLIAILQDIFRPRRPPDLAQIWDAGEFPADKIHEFGDTYAHRFDLFSEDTPFMQSADLSREPVKGDKLKTVAYLTPEIPAKSAITHYRHSYDSRYIVCPVCAAGGLLTLPAFATSGGAGIRPSINGVPPIYVLPGGETLFHGMALSLVTSANRPEVASPNHDIPWWRHNPIVNHKQEVLDVGYLHSLTFPARRVRLHPILVNRPCARCGRETTWNIRTMVFQMGESRPKDAAFWFDPFAAYKLPTGKSTKTQPTPIRPIPGKAIWREFSALFLAQVEDKKQITRRPGVLDQIAEARLASDWKLLPLRCVGIRTDMKMKIYEWVDAGFEISPALIEDHAAGDLIDFALGYATDCETIIRNTFYSWIAKQSGKRKRFQQVRKQMLADYWAALAEPFRTFYMAAAELEEREQARRKWADAVRNEAERAFTHALENTGDAAADLRKRAQAEEKCFKNLNARRKEFLE